MPESPSDLTYFISEKGDFVVIGFKGKMTGAAAATIEECSENLLRGEGRYVVLYLLDVSDVTAPSITALVRLQKAIRDKGGSVRVCLPKAGIGQLFVEKAAVRESEIAASLEDALVKLQGEASQR